DTMLRHTEAVFRGSKTTKVIADMPIHSYDNPNEALENAKRFRKAGAWAVKLEGAASTTLQSVVAISSEMPVMGHVGLTPQWLEENKVQGNNAESAQKILEQTLALQNAGCFAIVLECVPESLAQKITSVLRVPTIGIGAGRHCKGQVLVLYDLLGLYGDFEPKFAKRFGRLDEDAKKAVGAFVREVQEGKFPEEKHVFK
ncbi:MAG TPA: 3-methyl-2-oxobutanoate hydroxymethyltransferase, partial [Candidatus Norongarragalinales archaeon]|nr:3-methyl-2-oxobutanoate hydroxymethyltransferase [Candidatus Norongarragalinales archaeon]